MNLSEGDLIELEQLCIWLSHQPCKSAYSTDVIAGLPQLQSWVSHAWKEKRRSARLIYYQVGYGWRLRRNWERRLDLLRELIKMPRNHVTRRLNQMNRDSLNRS